MAASHHMPSVPPLSGRYLAFTDREQIALLHAQGQMFERPHPRDDRTVPSGSTIDQGGAISASSFRVVQ